MSNSAPRLTVPRMCLVTAAYQLAFGAAMISLGAGMLESTLGAAFPPAQLTENPILNQWIRLLGATITAIAVLNIALSRVRSSEAQRWIRMGSLAFWSVELVIDGLMMQLPAFLRGEPHVVASGLLVTMAFRVTLVSMWYLAQPATETG